MACTTWSKEYIRKTEQYGARLLSYDMAGRTFGPRPYNRPSGLQFFNSPCMIKETRRNIENMKVRCYLEHLDKHVFIPDIPNMRKANKTIAAAAADKTTIGESYEERIARMSSSKNLARKQCRLVDKDKSVNWLNCKATPPYERETSTTFMQDMNNGIVKNVLHKFIKLNENKEPVEDYLGFKTNTFEKTNKTNKTDNSFLNNKMKKEQTSILGRKLNIQPAWFHPVPSSKENLRAKRKAPKFKSSHTQTSPATSTTNILLNVISSQSDEIRVALKFQENDKKNDDQMVLKFAKDEDVTVKKCIEYFEEHCRKKGQSSVRNKQVSLSSVNNLLYS